MQASPWPRNTGTSKRSANRPLGEDKFPSVDMGNKLCARTLCIIWIAASLGAWWIVEQPQGSWMESHPCFQMVLRHLQVHRHRFTMGSYGAKSQKPTWLYSSDLVMIEYFDVFNFIMFAFLFEKLKHLWFLPHSLHHI